MALRQPEGIRPRSAGRHFALADEYGDVVWARFGPRYLVSSIIPTWSRRCSSTRTASSSSTIGCGDAKRTLGNGLLTSEGDFWRGQRKLAQPAFHRERIAAYGAA